MKKLFASALMLTALFLTVQVFGQDYQTKGSGNDTKKMKEKTTTTKSKSGQETKTATTTKQSEVTPAVKPPEGEKQDGKVSPQGTEQKPGSGTNTQAKPSTSQNSKTQTQPTGTGGTMTSAAAVQPGKIYDGQGNLVATIDKDGWIRNPKNRLIGQYTKSGEYFNKNRVKAGSVQNGIIRDKNGNEAGKIGQDGKVYGGSGKLLGTIAADGTITDNTGKKIGSATGVDKNVAVMVFFYQNAASSVKGGKK